MINGVWYRLHGATLPPVTETMLVGEVARRAALAQFGALGGDSSPVLAGHLGDGKALWQHQHAFYLPEDRDGDGRVDHLLIYAPAGFNPTELAALMRVERLYGGPLDLRAEVLLAWDDRVPGSADLAAGEADTWESATALILPRHPKRFRTGRPKLTPLGEQVDGPEDQLRREIALRREAGVQVLPDPAAIGRVERLPVPARGSEIAWTDFLWRKPGGGAASGLAFGLRITFPHPVRGPLAFGYGCHFGLGQFRPVGRRL